MLSSVRKFSSRVLRDSRWSLRADAHHFELSAIMSAEDEQGRPSDRLFDITLEAVQKARSVSMADVIDRMIGPPHFPDVWPGEHYKLLAGLVSVCQPKTVIEIGTAAGLSALAMRTELPPSSRIVTFDIIPWAEYKNTSLRESDFHDGAISQILGDVSDPNVMQEHTGLFESADLIFVDGPKDGHFECDFLKRLEEIGDLNNPLIVFDDIRVWNMLSIWRSIQRPKLDVTSFGHWSGTGLVDWTPGVETM